MGSICWGGFDDYDHDDHHHIYDDQNRLVGRWGQYAGEDQMLLLTMLTMNCVENYDNFDRNDGDEDNSD